MATTPRIDVTLWALRLILVFFVAGVIVAWAMLFTAHAWGDIPAKAWRYRSLVVNTVRAEAGQDAPVALFAAQLAQESGWNPEAVSPVGARGLAQFMPATARDMGRQRPDMGPALPTNPVWAVRAMVAYDIQNRKRLRAASEFDLWALTFMAYNGGLGRVFRDQAKAKAEGLNPLSWLDVAAVNSGRSEAAKRENNNYPRRILLHLMPAYEAAGWGKGVKP